MERTTTAVWQEKYSRWAIKVQKNGIRKSFYSSIPGRNGQREAHRKADAWLDDGVANQKIKISAAIKEFNESREGLIADSNIRNQKLRFKNWVIPVIGNLRVSEVCDNDLQRVLDLAFKKKKLSEKTLKNIRGDMSALIKFCRKSKYTAYRPEDVKIPSKAKESEKTIMQPEDLIKLFSIDTTTEHGNLIKESYIYAYRFQVLTGLRPGELMGIRPSDISGNILSVKRSIDMDGNITPGKNKNAKRAIVLTQTALQILSDQKDEYGYGFYLFNIFSQRYYRDHLERYCKANQIPKITPYELRHTFVSVAKSLPEGTIKSLVGHSNNMDTFGVYGHKLSGEDIELASLLEATFEKILLPEKSKEEKA